MNPEFLTIQDLAEHIGTTKSTVMRWKKLGCPGLDSRPYDVEQVCQWRDQNVQFKKPTDNSPGATLTRQKKEADLELVRVKKRLAEYDLAVKQNRLIEIEVCQDSHRRMATEIRRNLEAVPAKWADACCNLKNPADAKGVLQSIVDDLMRGLSRGETNEN